MVSLSRCLGVAVLFVSTANGVRVQRSHAQGGEFKLAGVPVYNRELAYKGVSSMSAKSQEVDWVVRIQEGPRAVFKTVHGTEGDLEAALSKLTGAMYAEADPVIEMTPEIPSQMSPESMPWGLKRVGAESRNLQGAGVHVFVLDTGIRTTHQEFTGRAVAALDCTTFEPTECNGDATCALDQQGHGTHCAGTSTGATFGVAPGSAVYSVRVLDERGQGSFSWCYKGLDWVVTDGARPAVASLSLGGRGELIAMRDAVEAAVDAGIVVVVAGGNSNEDSCNFSPANVPLAITVGSTTSLDERSAFSNYGRCTDMYAPGSDITSAAYENDWWEAIMSGTSMACPHISGGAALLLGENPALSASQVAAKLLDQAETGAISGVKGWHANELLWVGANAAPNPAPTPAPYWGHCIWYCTTPGACTMNECAGCTYC